MVIGRDLILIMHLLNIMLSSFYALTWPHYGPINPIDLIYSRIQIRGEKVANRVMTRSFQLCLVSKQQANLRIVEMMDALITCFLWNLTHGTIVESSFA